MNDVIRPEDSLGEGFAFACWYRLNFPFFSTYKAEYFNRCALDDWRHGYR